MIQLQFVHIINIFVYPITALTILHPLFDESCSKIQADNMPHPKMKYVVPRMLILRNALEVRQGPKKSVFNIIDVLIYADVDCGTPFITFDRRPIGCPQVALSFIIFYPPEFSVWFDKTGRAESKPSLSCKQRIIFASSTPPFAF